MRTIPETGVFCARFLDLNIKDFVTENKIFSITNKQNGQAILTYNQPLLDSVNLLDKIILKIYKSNKLTEPLKELVWKKEKNVNLLPGVQNYDEYVLKIECVLADGTPWATEIPFKAGPYIKHYLFKDGKTDYSIVIGKDASSSEQWAAQELQYWLKEISGVQFPVKFDNGKPGENEIIIGLNNHSRALLGDVQEPEKDDDTYTYQNVGSNLIIWGSRQRGTMYGVFSFLENELGFRWYSPKVTVIPEKEKYGFVKLNHSESPGIKVRNDFYHHAFNPEWAARNKVNGAMNYREQPGGVEPYWGVHTFNYFVPVSEFFEIHPEYFSLIDGKRISERTQLCLTNPDVLKIVKERMKNFMREHPEHLIYSLSQNDHYNPCQCEKCQAIVKEQGSEAGLMLWFVNQIAEEIEAEFPDKYIGTLAYQYTRKPPKTIRPRKNVVIRFCSIECCFVHDFKSCPQNASFLEDLEGWSKIADKLYVWDYVVNFHHYINPFPNFKVLQPNIQIFRDNNVMGIMEQAAYQGNGGEFAELRAYVISKLLWNPDCNVDAIINDFMYGYYGRSGQYVREYFDFLHNNIKPDIHMGIFAETETSVFYKAIDYQSRKDFKQSKSCSR